jgi:hypothetical protein
LSGASGERPQTRSRPSSRRRDSRDGEPGVRRAPWLFAAALALGVLMMGVATRSWWSNHASSSEAELARIQQFMMQADASEAQLRAWFERKQAIVERSPALKRSFQLLTAPVTVYLPASIRSPGAGAQLSIPAITVLLGSFDAAKLLDHAQRHQARLVQDLTQRLSNIPVHELQDVQASSRLRFIVIQSLMKSLEIPEAPTAYRTTYFESPGRYGVVDVVFPQQFTLNKLNPN